MSNKLGKEVPKAKPATSKSAKGRTISNAVRLDPTNPIPIEYRSRIFVSHTGHKYIPFLNPRDNFPRILLEAKTLSPTTVACITSKVQYCIGKGWFIKDKKEDKLLTEWAAAVNHNDDLNNVLCDIFENLFTLGNAYVEVVRGAVGGKKFVKVFMRSVLDCRLNRPDEDFDEPSFVIISKEFRREGVWNMNKGSYMTVPLHSFNTFDNPWVKSDDGFEHTIFHLKNKISGYDYYGMPSNVSSLPEQILEYQAARFNIDNFENNLEIGGMMLIKGNLTDEEARKIGKDIVFQHSGDGQRGKWVILSSQGGIEKSDIVPFNRDQQGSFIELDQHIQDKIVAANNWSGYLCGIDKKSGLGSAGSSYIRSIFDIANNTTIKPQQEYVIKKFIKPLMQICDQWMGTKWSQYDISLQSVLPVTFLGDIDINSITKVNEGRAIAGLTPIEGERGEQFIKAAAPKQDNNQPNNNPNKPNNVQN